MSSTLTLYCSHWFPIYNFLCPALSSFRPHGLAIAGLFLLFWSFYLSIIFPSCRPLLEMRSHVIFLFLTSSAVRPTLISVLHPVSVADAAGLLGLAFCPLYSWLDRSVRLWYTCASLRFCIFFIWWFCRECGSDLSTLLALKLKCFKKEK